jgi:hypothetical protein
VTALLGDFMHVLKTEVVEALDLELAELLVMTFNDILECLTQKKNDEVCPKAFLQPYIGDIFDTTLKCLAVFQSFRVQRKPDPENVAQSKKDALKVLTLLQNLSDEPDRDILEIHLPSLADEVFSQCTEEKCSGWALQNQRFRLMFALVIDIAQENHLRMQVGEFTLLEEFCRLVKGIMVNSESKNYKVKHLAVYTIFPVLVNKAAKAISIFESDLFMGILE